MPSFSGALRRDRKSPPSTPSSLSAAAASNQGEGGEMKNLKLVTRHFPFSPQLPQPHFLPRLAAGKIPAFSSASHRVSSRPNLRRLPFAAAGSSALQLSTSRRLRHAASAGNGCRKKSRRDTSPGLGRYPIGRRCPGAGAYAAHPHGHLVLLQLLRPSAMSGECTLYSSAARSSSTSSSSAAAADMVQVGEEINGGAREEGVEERMLDKKQSSAMSSLTISSATEEFLEVEELVDTRLSLVIGAGSPQRLPLTEKEASAGRKRKRRASTVKGGSDINDDSGGSGARKKLQLTSEQAAVMEKSFRAHNVLSHDEKHDLARRLGLKARQVEVWFQNRRARTKLKQTELDCELLRRVCERLSHDNERLRRDLAEARSSLSSAAFMSRLTSSSCPSCNKPGSGWPGVGLINRD
ncbi:hypothetical protein QYE76_020574 [Lolium multiflorum]|uniref:Homeobox domain-containing protein n=1 Tax=Lolium multiflorum TaxID=4521 RepID=A0AAD8R7A3_LOLMU|nr:hypothetical protein QYE76_020574 [Lolium multiflorum]